MTSLRLTSSNFPKLQDALYGWYWDTATMQPSMRQRIFSTAMPGDFDANALFYRGQVGVMDVSLKERHEGDSIDSTSGAFEDYYFQIKRRQYVARADIPKEIVDPNAAANWIQSWIQKFAEAADRTKEEFCAGILNKGPLTAGDKTYFNNGVPGYPDPNPGFIYVGLPLVDTAHNQSKRVTGTTYSNHTASLSFSRTNLQTVYNTMSVTNAYDRNGDKIVISPNMILANPTLKFTIDPVIESTVQDADLQVNPMAKVSWNTVYWRYLTDTDGWYVFEAGQGGGCPDLLLIEDWKPVEIEINYDFDRKVNVITGEIFFGAGVRDWRRTYCANVAAS